METNENKLPITIEPDRTKLHNILSASAVSFKDIISFYDIVEKYNLHDRFSVYTASFEDYINIFVIKYDNLSSIYRLDTSLYSDFNCYNKLYERTTSDINNFLNPNGRQEIIPLFGSGVDFDIKLSKSDFMRKFIYAINFLVNSYFKKIEYFNNQKENSIQKHNQYMNYKLELQTIPHFDGRLMKPSKYYQSFSIYEKRLIVVNLYPSYKDLSEYELKKVIIDELLNESLEKYDNQLKPNIENYSKLKDLSDIINKDYLEYTM
jgi:hypothetical protein